MVSSGGQSPASHRRGPGSIPKHSMWNTGTGGGFPQVLRLFPADYHSRNAALSHLPYTNLWLQYKGAQSRPAPRIKLSSVIMPLYSVPRLKIWIIMLGGVSVVNMHITLFFTLFVWLYYICEMLINIHWEMQDIHVLRNINVHCLFRSVSSLGWWNRAW
jgi:hypothetical protein